MKPKQIEDAFATWADVLRGFAETPAMDNILQKAVIDPRKENKKVWPTTENIFRCFKLTPYKDLVAVWIGQDPYPGTPEKCVATGIAMGIAKDNPTLPPTLKVIAKELQDTWPNIDIDYTFESWARQGILMLNTTLTVEAGNIGSHLHLWKGFTTYLLQTLSERNTGIIYICLGKNAQEYLKYINQDSNYIIRAAHPAAEAYSGGNAGFYGSNIFGKINDIMIKMYGKPINFGQLNT